MLVKEELVDYLIKGYIHVSRKDYLFFSNLVKIANEKKVTTGQNNLLDKLIDKYKRQLSKQNLDSEVLKKLPWKSPILQTTSEYLVPKVSYVDGHIEIKSPYNLKFIDGMRKQTLQTYNWDKKTKVYRAEYSTYALKQGIILVQTHYGKIEFCEHIKEFLKTISIQNAKFWSPTLLKVNDQYLIAAINETLSNCIKDIALNDDPKTLYTLSTYGIKIDDSVTQEDEFLKFASEYFYKVDIVNFSTLVEYMKKLEIDFAVVPTYFSDTKISKELKSILIENKIAHGNHTESRHHLNSVCLRLFSNKQTDRMISDIVNDQPHNRVRKYIHIVDSRPINVK